MLRIKATKLFVSMMLALLTLFKDMKITAVNAFKGYCSIMTTEQFIRLAKGK